MSGIRKLFTITALSAILLTGCAVPMSSPQEDQYSKTFPAPEAGQAGLYVFRKAKLVGNATRRKVYIDGRALGRTMNEVFFYMQITPGEHELSTQSQFGKTHINFTAEAGKNYYAEQMVKWGATAARTEMRMVSQEEGQKAVLAGHRTIQ